LPNTFGAKSGKGEKKSKRDQFQNGKSGMHGEERRDLPGLAREFTRQGSTEMLICQIVYSIVLHSNDFGAVSGRKEGVSRLR
jgi:hypothetical protein